jgi:hypothetical protein
MHQLNCPMIPRIMRLPNSTVSRLGVLVRQWRHAGIGDLLRRQCRRLRPIDRPVAVDGLGVVCRDGSPVANAASDSI